MSEVLPIQCITHAWLLVAKHTSVTYKLILAYKHWFASCFYYPLLTNKIHILIFKPMLSFLWRYRLMCLTTSYYGTVHTEIFLLFPSSTKIKLKIVDP